MLGGALQYRTCYSKRTNLGHNFCAPTATAEDFCDLKAPTLQGKRPSGTEQGFLKVDS
jgi:hypothetical protein